MAYTLCPQPCQDFLCAPRPSREVQKAVISLSCLSAQSRAVLLQAKSDHRAWRLQVIQGLDWVRQHYAPAMVKDVRVSWSEIALQKRFCLSTCR